MHLSCLVLLGRQAVSQFRSDKTDAYRTFKVQFLKEQMDEFIGPPYSPLRREEGFLH